MSNVSALMVREIVVVFVTPFDVPVMVTVAVPVVAVLLAVNVNVLVDVPGLVTVAGFELNDAVTPLGRLDADKVTEPMKPFCGVSVIVLMPLEPCMNVKLLGEAESEKFGAAVTLRLNVAVFVRLPDVPVIVTVLVPVVAMLVAVRVNVMLEDAGLVTVAGFGLNDALTPLGRPDADTVTLPLKPFCGLSVIVFVPLPPCVMPTLPADTERLKFGTAPTVNEIGLLLFMLGATHTDSGPEVAPVGTVMVIEVALQKLTGACTPFRYTALLP